MPRISGEVKQAIARAESGWSGLNLRESLLIEEFHRLNAGGFDIEKIPNVLSKYRKNLVDSGVEKIDLSF